MPHKDPQKRKEYNEVYARTEKGCASLKTGKRRYWEKLKADPVRLELSRSKVREAMRIRRLRPEAKEAEYAKRRARYKPRDRKPRPKKPKAMKPLTIRPKKVWATDKYKPLFVENKRTVQRGRPKKKKVERPVCDHGQGFTFHLTDLGMKRTCKNPACGRSFTEVGRPI
jgi:hypothetical protein